MRPVYRSVRLVILNDSNRTLTVSSAEVVLGEWAPGDWARARVAQIVPQSAATFATQSSTLHTASEAFVRLTSIAGPILVHWCRPWVGRFALRLELDADFWWTTLEVDDDDPSAIAALLTFHRSETDGPSC